MREKVCFLLYTPTWFGNFFYRSTGCSRPRNLRYEPSLPKRLSGYPNSLLWLYKRSQRPLIGFCIPPDLLSIAAGTKALKIVQCINTSCSFRHNVVTMGLFIKATYSATLPALPVVPEQHLEAKGFPCLASIAPLERVGASRPLANSLGRLEERESLRHQFSSIAAPTRAGNLCCCKCSEPIALRPEW